jgi:hypothetical protein
VAAATFLLCAVTSVVCLALLVRAYRAAGGRLVFWTAVCFAGLAISNVLLAIDEVIVPALNIPWRRIPGAIGLVALAYGLVAEEIRSQRARPRRRIVQTRSRASL